MKRKAYVSILLIIVMALSLLTGCGGGKRVFDDSGNITMSTEYEVYGGDITTIGCIIENNTDKTVSYSHVYEIEKLEEEEWTNLLTVGLEMSSVKELEGGKKAGFVVKTDAIEGTLADGTYRIVKQIGEKYYAAEFEIGKSEYTAETPFGMMSFDSVPADYSADKAISDGCAVLGEKEDLTALISFVEKATLGLPGMVRVAEYNGGEFTLSEIVYDGECYSYTVRSGGEKTEKKYPFMFTDEEAVYLSDCVSNGYLNSFPEAVKVPVFTADKLDLSKLVPAVKELTRANLTGDFAVYGSYSPDNNRYIKVMLENSIIQEQEDKIAYLIGTPEGVKEYGSDDAEGVANQITFAEWLDDTTIIVSFKTFYGINYFETRDTSTGEVLRHSYSESYTIEDGKVTYIG